MKIVIDIQDDVYRVLKEDIYPIPNVERMAIVFKTLVKKGIPLDKMRAEIKKESEVKTLQLHWGEAMGLNRAIDIIDKYGCKNADSN